MKYVILFLAAIPCLASAPGEFRLRISDPPPAEPGESVVQLAILLDTSGSMSGLIEQAKGQLWKIVNEFIFAKQNGRRPQLEVALYEYGKSSLSQESGWIRQIVPLSDDLDRISQELFALTTNGGDEYCGWVIRDAVNQLQWDPNPSAYKAIFIAGNEPFTQGPVDYADACRAAIQRGIIVNTIHCGAEAEGIRTQWREGALLADGKYMVIDQDQAVVHFEAPQDGEIERLSAELNKTYLPYGQAGRLGVQNQMAQDSNSAALASQGALVQRAITKSSAFYRNGFWDLVDAYKENEALLGQLEESELPEELRKMSEAERQEFIEEKSRDRAEIQARIQRLGRERQAHVAELMKRHSVTNTLDAAILSAVREQAARKSYRFEK